MKVIIIGAGLSGLLAAYVLTKQGHLVIVLEQRPNLSPAGTGMMIRPGASRLLISWGLRKEFEAVSDESPAVLLKDLQTGEVRMRNIATEVSEWPDWGLSRKVMQGIFYRKAVEVGAEVRFGIRVLDVGDNDGHAWVQMAEEKMEADLVIAADGVRSRVRRLMLGEEFEPRISNVTLYGTMVPLDVIAYDEEANVLCREPNLTVWHEEGGFVVGRMHMKSKEWSGLYGMKVEEKDESGRLWDEEGDIELVRKHFANICPSLKAALSLARSCDRWKLTELPPLPRWTSKDNRRIILLGDSAHAMHPNAAQGFSQTIEDIGVLEYLFSTDLSVKEITDAWQKIRMPRVERVKEYAKWNTVMFLGEDVGVKGKVGSVGERGNVMSLKDVKPDGDARFNSRAFMKWAHDFDAVGEAERYIEQMRGKSRL